MDEDEGYWKTVVISGFHHFAAEIHNFKNKHYMKVHLTAFVYGDIEEPENPSMEWLEFVMIEWMEYPF